MRRILAWITAGLIVLATSALFAYLRDVDVAYERLQGKSTVMPSPHGDIEYVERGAGPAVLVIHGAGGGYDQGELIAQTVLDDGFRWIIPSRFGYLGSTLPAGATWDDQAHAYAYLLDRLGVAKVAVVALSQGGPSALLFAALHPDRVSSLTCLSCGVAPSASEDQSDADRKGEILRAIFKFDLPYWTISRLFKRQFMGIIGASDEVIDSLAPQQREIVDRYIAYMNPASLRAAGVAFDNEAHLPGGRISAITAPTLIFHARDDGLQLHRNAEFAAATIPGARLVSFERGGHILLVVEQAAIRTILKRHILDHAGAAAP